MRRATSSIHTSEIEMLLNLPSIILVLIFVNVKTLIMLILYLEQARGRSTWSLRAIYMVLAGDLVPAGTTLVTPGLTWSIPIINICVPAAFVCLCETSKYCSVQSSIRFCDGTCVRLIFGKMKRQHVTKASQKSLLCFLQKIERAINSSRVHWNI